MMGLQLTQKELFSYSVDLDERVHAEHPLRKVTEVLDFGFVREQTAKFYGNNGNESVDPAVVMKLMFLLFFDDISNERELMRILPYRLDYLWFLGYGLDDKVPDHSVLSKARRRWGTGVFDELFTMTVAQCMEAGLVDGDKIHMDGSLIDANASRNSVIKSSPELIAQLRSSLADELNKMDDSGMTPGTTPKNSKMASMTDPDCEMVHHGRDKSRPRYKTHRVVDDQCGVITATETTPGATAENDRLIPLVEQHEANTKKRVTTVVADSQYGTADNFRSCHERGIRSHMADSDNTRKTPFTAAGLFRREQFAYDRETNTYICPAGQTLHLHQTRDDSFEYRCRASICTACALKLMCTKSRNGRYIKRHRNQPAIHAAKAESESSAARRDRVRRKWLMEGSFADAANNHGLKRARWRRLWRQKIQDLMICAVQNIRKLIGRPKLSPAEEASAPLSSIIDAKCAIIQKSVELMPEPAPNGVAFAKFCITFL